MADLLFLTHRIPYPPNKGDKIRSWHFLRHLAGKHRVHLGCFVDDPEDLQYAPILRELCAECRFELLPRRLINRRTIGALTEGLPISVGHYRSHAMTAWATALAGRLDAVYVFSSAMVPHAPQGPYRVLDFVDVDSDKWRQYAAAKSFPVSWIYRREHRTLLDFDRRAAVGADAILFVSRTEADLFQSLAPEAADRVRAVPNGVDVDYFEPAPDRPEPEGFSGADIVFTGAMDYVANIDAVTWFAHEVMPELRKRQSDALFWIVGSAPTRQVLQLAELPGIRVTGRVPDIRPWIQHAAVIVAPLWLGRGTQNKVLEAMAMARPVIAAPAACRGIHVQPGEDIMVAGDAAGFVETICGLLADPAAAAALGHRARLRARQSHSWPAALESFDAAFAPLNIPSPIEA
jgi:sugar transferase (PEP-CTERM/EpsH1 system associated)